MNSLLMTADNGQKVYNGTKTQTRRMTGLEYPNSDAGAFELIQQDGQKFFFNRIGTKVGGVATCPYRVGEIRYIREPHYLYGRWKRDGHTKTGKPKYRFMADRSKGACYPDNPPPRVCTKKSATGWFRRPGMFMFEWAARSCVRITGLRAERVQEISADDAMAELGPIPHAEGQYRFHFSRLWDPPDIHGPGAWDRNDWVWRVEFERVKQ
ncbi:MAG: hypothetical protein OEV08_05110 [Nitrospira sp.]|nr:hypothetical protein [Nitrospira sp.]